MVRFPPRSNWECDAISSRVATLNLSILLRFAASQQRQLLDGKSQAFVY